ncbi:MAG: ATPase, T2SS/T4P/T4SS family [Eubacteriales bacterium]|nr:ATPase, T2SS/T4P/T4SS family [Lachnospiraceae bacterium]MDO5127083.1 ATPase, T2SS/T4P/T4SS family [Eubacteriales bacterium]
MEMRNNKNIRIGDVLQELGYINEEQINQAVAYQKENKGVRLGGALIALGFITEKQVLEALGHRLGYDVVNISDLSVDINAVEMIPKILAEKYNMIGYRIEDNVYYIVVDDPLNFYGIEDIRQVVGMDLHISLCEKVPLENSIHYYYSEVSARQAAKKASDNTAEINDVVEISVEEGDDDTPIINLFNSILVRAYNSNVSDIHIEPFEKKTSVRMRMDGVITDFMTLQKNIHNSLIARIKILGDLDIAERRIPQDGHFRINIEGVNLNVRVSVIPTVFGEKAVLRLLASAGNIDHLSTYGMTERNYNLVKKMLQSPNGIIYVTGPTGSGKSTTLYMLLEDLAKRSVNISTIEDPVEKNVANLNQMQVNNTAGLTFEIGLRALLRQDPDIIMVGETRDAETAGISVRAAITGHLVLSTLHTNDAASSVVRLVDMGVEPYMIASSLVGIIAQRLVRKVCPFCGEWGPMTEEEEAIAGVRFAQVKHAKGCRQCNNTGYKGRISIHEILTIDRKVREMITRGSSVEEIKDYAISEQEMSTLKKSALDLVADGTTTVDELLRVSYYE